MKQIMLSASRNLEAERSEFRAQMDKRMEEYRSGVHFIGYLWVNWRTGREGGAFINLNKCSAKVGARKEVLRVIKQLEREFGVEVYTYTG